MSPVGTVLVVDDQIGNLEALAQALEPIGYEVVPAADGETGLRLARARQPDVILLDIMMPGMDGYEVCRRLKEDEETRLLPVVFLTGLDSREAESLKALRRAGYLHDIGKIGIRDAVLLKPGTLTEEEWAIMRSHVDIGVGICAPLRTLRNVLPTIRHHHEKRDGSGYPAGLKGDEIPLLARVFQVVDVFDALTNDRPYRRALSVAEAIQRLRQETERGWWDERVVTAFSDMLREAREGSGGSSAA